MKTAILISGYLRTFKSNLPKIKETLLNQFSGLDIYIHLTKNESKEDIYLNSSNLEEDIEYINKQLNPLSIICEENYFFSEEKKENNTYNLWFKYYKLNELKKLNEESSGIKYDLVIKYRPDLNLISTNIFDRDFSEEKIFIPSESLIDMSKLKSEKDKFICDIFAFGNSRIMDNYFSIFEYLENLINEYGPVSETVLYHHLENNSVNYELLDIDYNVILSNCNVFAICGDSGTGKTTLGNILKKYFSNSFMLEGDRYHKWERNDDNWKKFTHLNPDSNFLTKMNQDIFDLKIGNTVYQVDYDHKTGKFTEKETINSSDTVIVCGLHSLYTTDENLYNLKIYIDTEEKLKNYWKIERDTKHRGYTLEKSLNQINSRVEDYHKYIEPQKQKSDIIISFYYSETNIEPYLNNNICLKVSIKKTFDVESLVKKIFELGIFVKTSTCDEFFILDFGKYTTPLSSKIENLQDMGNFYDYIMFIIINLNKPNL